MMQDIVREKRSLYFRYCMAAVSGLLFASSVMKVYGLATVISPLATLTPYAETLLAGVELLLAIWAFTGKWPKILRPVTLTLFIAFLSRAIYEAFLGNQSCGCFGSRIETTPKFMIILDAVVIASIVCFRPSTSFRTTIGFIPALSAAATGFAVATFMILSSTLTALHGTSGAQFKSASVTKVGRRWSLIDDVVGGQQLESGQWTVLILNPSCPECERIREAYLQYTSEEFLIRYGVRVMLIEATDPVNGVDVVFPSGVVSRLSHSAGSELPSPAIIDLQNGIVAGVKSSFVE